MRYLWLFCDKCTKGTHAIKKIVLHVFLTTLHISFVCYILYRTCNTRLSNPLYIKKLNSNTFYIAATAL